MEITMDDIQSMIMETVNNTLNNEDVTPGRDDLIYVVFKVKNGKVPVKKGTNIAHDVFIGGRHFRRIPVPAFIETRLKSAGSLEDRVPYVCLAFLDHTKVDEKHFKEHYNLGDVMFYNSISEYPKLIATLDNAGMDENTDYWQMSFRLKGKEEDLDDETRGYYGDKNILQPCIVVTKPFLTSAGVIPAIKSIIKEKNNAFYIENAVERLNVNVLFNKIGKWWTLGFDGYLNIFQFNRGHEYLIPGLVDYLKKQSDVRLNSFYGFARYRYQGSGSALAKKAETKWGYFKSVESLSVWYNELKDLYNEYQDLPDFAKSAEDWGFQYGFVRDVFGRGENKLPKTNGRMQMSPMETFMYYYNGQNGKGETGVGSDYYKPFIASLTEEGTRANEIYSKLKTAYAETGDINKAKETVVMSDEQFGGDNVDDGYGWKECWTDICDNLAYTNKLNMRAGQTEDSVGGRAVNQILTNGVLSRYPENYPQLTGNSQEQQAAQPMMEVTMKDIENMIMECAASMLDELDNSTLKSAYGKARSLGRIKQANNFHDEYIDRVGSELGADRFGDVVVSMDRIKFNTDSNTVQIVDDGEVMVHNVQGTNYRLSDPKTRNLVMVNDKRKARMIAKWVAQNMEQETLDINPSLTDWHYYCKL